jgi:DNA-binding transcriptional MerR regulator
MNAQPLPQSQLEETAVTEQHQNEPQIGPLTGRVIEAEPVKVPQIKKSAGAFRTISEVADELNVQQHVLRFWETKFSQIRPLKRGGGRRYYRPEDVDLLKTIHKLLYSEGYTIKGAQKLFREKGKNQVVEKTPVPQNTNQPQAAKPQTFSQKQRDALESIAEDLRELRGLLDTAE